MLCIMCMCRHTCERSTRENIRLSSVWTHYSPNLTALRCVQQRYSARTGSMCRKMMNDGGWAQHLGGHACPRHNTHLCRHFPHRLRRLSAASSRSRWKAALVDRCCWFSTTGAIIWKSSSSWLQQAHMARLTHRSRRQKAAGRHVYELQLALTMQTFFGSTWP